MVGVAPADTDGSWDGWVGVSGVSGSEATGGSSDSSDGVGYSENVVLYRHTLHTE